MNEQRKMTTTREVVATSATATIVRIQAEGQRPIWRWKRVVDGRQVYAETPDAALAAIWINDLRVARPRLPG